MNHSTPNAGERYQHRKDGYTVAIQPNDRKGFAVYRREFPVMARTTAGTYAPVTRLCTRQAHHFHRDFIALA